MNPFDELKAYIPIEAAAERYGLHITRSHKAICPYHSDTRPSLSFKGNRFKCFSCSASGSVIDLVQKLCGLSTPLEAARLLDSDYGLGLFSDKPDMARIRREATHRANDNALYAAFETWERSTYHTLCTYLYMLREDKTEYAPKDRDEAFRPQFVAACRNIEYIEYLIDYLRGADFTARLDFYKNGRNEVAAVEYALKARRNKPAMRWRSAGLLWSWCTGRLSPVVPS